MKQQSKLEKQLIGRGYELVDETPPFRTYQKHTKRLIYHISSGKIWGSWRGLLYGENTGEEVQSNKE